MKKTGFTKPQWIILYLVASVNLFGSMSASIQAPFYPAEAEKKGATATEHGFVLGVFELTSFLASPLFGKIVEKQGPKFLLGRGIAFSSAAVILYGFLDYIQNRFLFIGLSLILRILEAMGSSAAVVSAFAMIGSYFPDNLSTVFASMEIFFGIGYIIAPTIGGLLFQIGGFPLPFLVIGVYGLVCAILVHVVPISTYERSTEIMEYNIRDALRIPSIALNVFCVFFIESTGGFYTALLEPHLRIFNLTPAVTSSFFVICGATYGLTSPLIGRLLDTCVGTQTMLVLACVFSICSFTLIGPLPFLPFKTSIPLCIIALFIQGLAYATGYVSTFTDSFRAAKNAGYPDGVGTYGLISGIWTSGYSLGGFIGPSIAGILYDLGGFRNATVFVWLCSIFLLTVVIVFIRTTEKRQRGYQFIISSTKNETEKGEVRQLTSTSFPPHL